MKTYALPDRLDEGEVEARKCACDHDLEGVKVLAMNLIDEGQVYLQIQEEDGNVVSTIQSLRKLTEMVKALNVESIQLANSNEPRRIEIK